MDLQYQPRPQHSMMMNSSYRIVVHNSCINCEKKPTSHSSFFATCFFERKGLDELSEPSSWGDPSQLSTQSRVMDSIWTDKIPAPSLSNGGATRPHLYFEFRSPGGFATTPSKRVCVTSKYTSCVPTYQRRSLIPINILKYICVCFSRSTTHISCTLDRVSILYWEHQY